MVRALGAHAVGMSTVHEVIALRHMGVRVGALSCITNLAAGISPAPARSRRGRGHGARAPGRARRRCSTRLDRAGPGDDALRTRAADLETLVDRGKRRRAPGRTRPYSRYRVGAALLTRDRPRLRGVQRRERDVRRHAVRRALGDRRDGRRRRPRSGRVRRRDRGASAGVALRHLPPGAGGVRARHEDRPGRRGRARTDLGSNERPPLGPAATRLPTAKARDARRTPRDEVGRGRGRGAVTHASGAMAKLRPARRSVGVV